MSDISVNGNGKNGDNGKPMACPSCFACQGGGMGGCGSCGWHGHHLGWMIVKVIVALFLLGVVFSVGILMGELRMVVGGGYGRSTMRSYYGNPVGTYPTMGGQGYAIPGATSTVSR